MPAIKRRAKVDDEFEIDFSTIEEEEDDQDIEALLGDEEDDVNEIEAAIKETTTVPRSARRTARRLTPSAVKNRAKDRRAARARRAPRARAAVTRRAAARRSARAPASRRATTRAPRARARRARAKRAPATATRVSVLPKGQISLNELADMAGITVPGMYTALKRHGYEKNPDTGRWSFTKSEAKSILAELKNAEGSRIGSDTVGPGSMGGISHDKRKVAKAGGFGSFVSRASNRGGRSRAKVKPATKRPARRTIARRAARRAAPRAARRTIARRGARARRAARRGGKRK